MFYLTTTQHILFMVIWLAIGYQTNGNKYQYKHHSYDYLNVTVKFNLF